MAAIQTVPRILRQAGVAHAFGAHCSTSQQNVLVCHVREKCETQQAIGDLQIIVTLPVRNARGSFIQNDAKGPHV
jgi:hypothetical protein